MNLIDAKWIPVRRKSRMQDWISPLQIGDADIIALDASRADFNGALAQFLIGLLQTTTLMDSQIEWEEYLDNPPSEAMLAKWLDPVRDAFVLDGDGARFMQDLTLVVDNAEAKSIAALLIDSPGENALKLNTDHFIKRDFINAMCPDCVAQALFSLQISAPSGGAGHRTSLRGGGPLTTLVVGAIEQQRNLWRDLWLNIRERTVFLSHCGDAQKTAQKYSFPWLVDIAELQKEKGEFSPLQGHPALVFWAMPRRIRLDFENCHSGVCELCNRVSDRLVSRYVTKNYGLNYKGAWNHPLSPYYENKPEEWLPFHPQPGGYGYKHWLPWALGASRQDKAQRPATVVSEFLTTRHRSGQFRIWAFGYDMDNMKARCWYEATLPLYGLASHDQRAQSIVQAVAGQWVEAASLVALYLRDAVKQAWFSSGAEVRGDLSHIDSAFYAATEQKFYGLLRQLIEAVRDAEDDPVLSPLREQWRSDLIAATLRLFDNTLVGTAPIERQNPRRIAEAHEALVAKLHGDKLKQVVGLAIVAPEKIKKAKKNSSKTQEA